MPQLDKETFSRYLRSNCQRQLRLYLHRDEKATERKKHQPPIPDQQPPRPGLARITEAGRDWEEQKQSDLRETFPADALVGDSTQQASGQWKFAATPLADALSEAKARIPSQVDGCFLVETSFDVRQTFKAAVGVTQLEAQHGLTFAGLRTDLIEVTQPGTPGWEVHPDGKTTSLPTSDARLRLAVSEIKLQSEPSANYFAEVVLYAMMLAGWLVDEGLGDEFVVVSNGSFIWKGSTTQSALRELTKERAAVGATPTYTELREALRTDVEEVPYSVFAPRVHTFFGTDLPEALAEPDWTKLFWHVDNRCVGCVFAGFPWGTEKPEHCVPTAKAEGHLSSVAYVSQGATVALQQGGVTNIDELGALAPTDEAFDGHQSLRATRTVIADRVKALQGADAGPATESGSSAVMPKWANLRVFLTTDFDPSSAISVSFGMSASWVEPYERHTARNDGTWDTKRWRPEVWVVDSKDGYEEEAKMLLALLDRIREIIAEVEKLDDNKNRTTIQFYLWDQLEMKHFSRVIGRHLDMILANRDISHLAWLFPTEETLPNPKHVTRSSPVTVVSDVVRAVLAAPVSHVYTLLPIAREYHPDYRGPAASPPASWGKYSVHPHFEDPFTDQIPAERIHEIWARSTKPSWAQRVGLLVETVETRLAALRDVTEQLTKDLGSHLTAQAPKADIGAFKPRSAISFDGQLWWAYAKLNAALDELDVYQTRAMPPHEREARFRSAHLTKRLLGQDEADALKELGLSKQSGRRVYRLGEKSREVKFREGDFTVALAPADRPTFLDETFGRVVDGTSLEHNIDRSKSFKKMQQVCAVSVVAIDREKLVVVLDPNFVFPQAVEALEDAGVVDFSNDVMLDPTPSDFFTARLEKTLHAIGNPPQAAASSIVDKTRRAIGQTSRRGPRTTVSNPAAEVLWEAKTLNDDRRSRSLGHLRDELNDAGMQLNDSQWGALEDSLSRRVALIWGPPGTGKSQTLRALLLVAIKVALAEERPLRILLTASTYTAVDNVLLPLLDDLPKLLSGSEDVSVRRLRSGASGPPADPRAVEVDCEVSAGRPSQALRALRGRLHANSGVTLVAATPQQAHNLLVAQDGEDNSAQQEAFDLITIDEASQMDVAQATLPIAARAEDGQVVFAGDDLQLAPIHQAEAPQGLEDVVGSVYRFIRGHHEVQPQMLEVNYRSNDDIVRFGHHAGYDPRLRAHSPHLELRLDGSGRPDDWPDFLAWTDEWEGLIDPTLPTSCFVYPDALWSSQWNEFEADAVVAMIVLLRGRQLDVLANDLNPGASTATAAIWDDKGFWEHGVGVVTPHKAQQALILGRLQRAFPDVDPALMRRSVDTVERFQGQQRQLVIASFALGDPDAIRDEEEFLMSLNRFNVMASRPRAKFVALVSQAVVDHLARDIEVLHGSALLKAYITTYCSNSRLATLSHLDADGELRDVTGQLRWR